MNKQSLIKSLQLERHIEGGYYRRTYESGHTLQTQRGERLLMTSIYYLLTDDQPIGHLHQNQSDILHFFHSGAPVDYFIITRHGELQTATLGPDPSRGHLFQLLVESGSWKASQLRDGEFGLISEAVAPGFDFADMRLAEQQEIAREFPQHWPAVKHLIK